MPCNTKLRTAVITEALTWIGTPYHHAGRVKGVGVDCLTFLMEVFSRTGVVPPQKTPFYRPDFMMHSAEETYLNGLLEHGREVKVPQPADVAIFKWGRIYAHAGIVVDWPWILHAAPAIGVVRMRGDTGKLSGRAVKFISAFDDGEP